MESVEGRVQKVAYVRPSILNKHFQKQFKK